MCGVEIFSGGGSETFRGGLIIFFRRGGEIEIFSEESHGGLRLFLGGVEIFWKGWNFFGGG